MSAKTALKVVPPAASGRFDFEAVVTGNGVDLSPIGVRTLQINITKLCNQACHHCHVDASPHRTESMDTRTVDRCIEILASYPEIGTLDVTGGAPELHPDFDRLVIEARKLGKEVLVRHNLTVIFDGNPRTGEQKQYLPEFFARNKVGVISSLPYYQEYYTDKQRGRGVFEKSIDAIKLLNDRGYGIEGSGLVLNLVYNPVGAFLPGEQSALQSMYKRELGTKFGLSFNNLFTITNMPIHRFRRQLEKLGGYDEYMERLLGAFNPHAAEGIMCRSLVSVGYDGRIFDCDFNQMLDMEVQTREQMTVFNFDIEALKARAISFAPHCFGCTAGAGSSCGGATA